MHEAASVRTREAHRHLLTAVAAELMRCASSHGRSYVRCSGSEVSVSLYFDGQVVFDSYRYGDIQRAIPIDMEMERHAARVLTVEVILVWRDAGDPDIGLAEMIVKIFGGCGLPHLGRAVLHFSGRDMDDRACGDDTRPIVVAANSPVNTANQISD